MRALLLLLILLAGCQQYQTTNQYLSTIIDLTEEDSYKPSTKEVLSYLEKGHSSDGIELSLRYVGETRYAEKYRFILPTGETGWFSNEDTRRTKRRVLLKSFKDTLNKYKKGLSPRSEIFRLVVDEANRLSKFNGIRSILAFTDLKEHSSLFSIYDKRQLQKLYKSQKLLAQEFSKQVPIVKDLSGITIHILHQPKLQDDQLFTALVALYRAVFESRGASVVVSKTHKFAI